MTPATLQAAPVSLASMGPRSENRGYKAIAAITKAEQPCFNGSTVREPWLFCDTSMSKDAKKKLQWVHGPRTVVMSRDLGSVQDEIGFNGSTVREPWLSSVLCKGSSRARPLQWVHGPRTVVMGIRKALLGLSREASMGPRSENRGYADNDPQPGQVVWASMGPRSENRGYQISSSCRRGW